jgi:DNA helicase HerA-like ATPase
MDEASPLSGNDAGGGDPIGATDHLRPSVAPAPVQPLPTEALASLKEEIAAAGGEWQEGPEFEGAVGHTMYDTPSSKDNTVTVLLPAEKIAQVPSQSLVRIKSRPKEKGGDGRQYLGAVVEGPFAEPDGLRADAPIVVTTTVRGGMFLPKYHGRVQVSILGEEVDGMLVPPRFRPLPNSPVFVLDQEETAEKLHLLGDITLGLAVGYDEMPVRLPTQSKLVFPRHFGILGTTGGGKSTTVSTLVSQLQQSGTAVIIFDTEGEYTSMHQPTEDPTMLRALQRRGLQPHGIPNTHILHLVGRETSNPQHPHVTPFSLRFEDLSPYALSAILDLTEAQDERFMKAYDIARQVLMDLKIYPTTEQEKEELLELDEMERGYPRLTLGRLYDIVRLCADTVAQENTMETPLSQEFAENRARVLERIRQAQLPGHVGSWRKVQGHLGRLLRLRIFDNPRVPAPNYAQMTQPGRVTIIDLSDTDSPQVNNLVIAQILRGLHLQQDRNYQESERTGRPPRRTVIVIEEAHEFLSAHRRQQMPVLFEQVARMARRGRKRWLGLVFVTQLPQHLPDEVLGLINNYILHKIADENVISRLKRSIGGIDEALWARLPNLAPGQAIVSAGSMARPLLVAIDPAPCKLRMVV